MGIQAGDRKVPGFFVGGCDGEQKRFVKPAFLLS